MYFLCKNHHKVLMNQPCNQLNGLWFEWMSQASIYYEVDLLPKALSYAGSAIDLSLILMSRSDINFRGDASKKLVLSTIYLTNMLKHQKEFEKAYYYKSSYSKILQKYLLQQELNYAALEIEESAHFLEDENKHISFFESHINLMIKPVENVQGSQVLH